MYFFTNTSIRFVLLSFESIPMIYQSTFIEMVKRKHVQLFNTKIIFDILFNGVRVVGNKLTHIFSVSMLWIALGQLCSTTSINSTNRYDYQNYRDRKLLHIWLWNNSLYETIYVSLIYVPTMILFCTIIKTCLEN